MGREEELRASAHLIGDALTATADIAADVHRAIARRVAGLLPAVAGPANAMHESIASVAYSAVSVALRLASAAGAEVLAATGDPSAPPPRRPAWAGRCCRPRMASGETRWPNGTRRSRSR